MPDKSMEKQQTVTCPKCKGSVLTREGWKIRKDGSKTQRYRCRACNLKFTLPVAAQVKPVVKPEKVLPKAKAQKPKAPAPTFTRGARVKALAGQHIRSGPGTVLHVGFDGFIMVQFMAADTNRTVWIRASDCAACEQANPPAPLHLNPQMQAAKIAS